MNHRSDSAARESRTSYSQLVYVLVVAVVGWIGVGMEVVVGKHAGQSQGVGRMSGDAREFPECEVNTLITPDRSTIHVRSYG